MKNMSSTTKNVTHNYSLAILENIHRRDVLLKAATRASQELLSESEHFDLTINKVLGILGEATQVDRVYVWSIHNAPNPEEDPRLYTSQLYEWSEGAEPQQGLDLVTDMLVEEGIPTWIDTFLAGKCVNSLVKNMPQEEREVLEPQGIISILTAPIMFHGHLWGFIGFDNCHAEYTWSQEEEDILRTTGTMLSTAIHSRRSNEALYEAQERFKGVEEATGDIIWTVDATHNITYISPRLQAVLQFRPDEVIGKAFSSLFLHPEEFIYTATSEHYIMRDFELRALCKDGSIRWLRSSCKYIFDAEGTMLHGFGSSSDVTRIHEAQDALKIANKELEQAITISNELAESAQKANAIKSDFLANMSHEIRTPMNAIMGITHILKHTLLSQEQSEYIAKIDSSSESLLKIITDILDFSKLQDGDINVDESSFALSPVLEEVRGTALHWADEKNVQFSITVAPQVLAHYVGDALRLKQILTSLVTNAVKFTHIGKIDVAVTVSCETEESALLQFSIKDTGIGIPVEKLDTLFEGFSQADISSTRRYGGVGLGLALCKHLTMLMGGNIWCESTEGVGSTFFFTCRLKKETQKALLSIRPLNDMRILAALPLKEKFEKIRNMLMLLGYVHVDFAENIQAMQKALCAEDEKPLPDVIILHHKFADVPAITEALQADSAAFKHIPIMYYSPDTEKEIPVSFISIDSLGASTLQDSFLKVLGSSFAIDPVIYQQGLEDLLRNEHTGKKVLLVEDNPINQMIAQTILEDVGLVVTVANDGEEGCEMVYKDDFDMVIMDIQMPRMDGISATQKIREDLQFSDLPIIAMTAHALQEDREKSLRAGMNDHTTKPIDTTELFKTLLYWLSKAK